MGRRALYEFDGTQAPRKILALQPDERATDLTSNGKALFYLSGRMISDGIRLMRTGGTVAGTAKTQLLATNHADLIDDAGEVLLFRVADTSVWRRNPPHDLWMSNGTSEGTSLLMPNFYPSVRASLGSVLVFRSGNRLWRTDGTAAGTFLLAGNLNPDAMSVRKPYAYFISGQDMWRTDGTQTTLLRRFQGAQTAGVAGSRLIAIGHYDRTYGVYGADASGGAPEPLVSIVTASANAATPAITHAGALAYFVVRSNGTGDELWRTDGTAAGTYSLLLAYSFSWLSVLGDRLAFFADDYVHGREPWITDGTREGTSMIANLAPEGVVHGTVTDAATGAPIENAIIQTGSHFLRTDAEGRYTIEGAIGPMTVQARTETHVAQTRTLTVEAHEDLTADFALTPGGRIAGRVLEPNGKPLNGFRVEVTAEDRSWSWTASTSADGTFVTTLLPTTVRWNVRAQTQFWHNAAAQDGVALTPYETRTVDLVMTPYGRVRIRMVDSVTGGDVRTHRAGYVSAFDRNGNLYSGESVTHSVADLGLPDGDYQFVIQSEVYRSRWLDGDDCASRTCSSVPRPRRGKVVRVSGGTTVTTDLVTRPIGGSVRAMVVDGETGLPVRGTYVQVVIGASGGYGSCVTDALGRCETEPIYPDGSLTVITWPSSAYLRSTTPLEMHFETDPRPQVKVRLTRGGTLVGRVTDRTGRGLGNAQVTIADQTISTDPAGYYNIRGVAAGSYRIIVHRHGYATFEREGVMMTNSEKTTLDVTLLR